MKKERNKFMALKPYRKLILTHDLPRGLRFLLVSTHSRGTWSVYVRPPSGKEFTDTYVHVMRFAVVKGSGFTMIPVGSGKFEWIG